MVRPSGYLGLWNLTEELMSNIRSLSDGPLMHSEEPMIILQPEFRDKMTSLNQRIDIPIIYDGFAYYITLRRRNIKI